MARPWLLAALLLPAACTYIQNPTPSPDTHGARMAASMDAEPLPASGPIREPYTTYFRVEDGSGTLLGYLVRYDEFPAHVDHPPARQGTEGSYFVEDRAFKRIGVITPDGKAFSYRGTQLDPVDQRPVAELLPRFFGKPDARAVPLH